MPMPMMLAMIPWRVWRTWSIAGCVVCCVVLWSLPVTLSSAQADNTHAAALVPDEASLPLTAPSDGTLDSPALVERLWPASALQGNANDARMVRLRPPDRVPPARLVPHQQLIPLAPAWQNSIRRVQPWQNRKVVALTFDLCERADHVTGYDAQIVHYLRTAHVRATAGGKWLRSHLDRAMQLMADPLFEVGNHGWTHGNLRVLTGQRLRDQIVWAQAQYELLWEELRQRAQRQGIATQEIDNMPRVPLTFRFPYGTCSPEALHVLAAYGLPAIQWDVVSGDPVQSQTVSSMARTMLRQTRPGSIVVFHANGRGHGTAAALPRIVAELRARGFAFVTVSELLRSGTVMATEECYEQRPGDNRRYDNICGEGTGS